MFFWGDLLPVEDSRVLKIRSLSSGGGTCAEGSPSFFMQRADDGVRRPLVVCLVFQGGFRIRLVGSPIAGWGCREASRGRRSERGATATALPRGGGWPEDRTPHAGPEPGSRLARARINWAKEQNRGRVCLTAPTIDSISAFLA